MPRVSVIIPAFNVANYICTTLRYALLSEFDDLEIIVVDDGSQDDTAALVHDFDPRVRLIRQPNTGMSASRNKAIESSDSEFVALLDADDIWHPQKLGAQVQLLVDKPSYGLAFTEFRSWDGIAPIKWPRSAACSGQVVDELTGWIYHQLVLTNWALPSSWLVRRSAIESVGLFRTDNHLTDDWEYVIRFSRSFEIAKLASVLVLYRQSPFQLSKTLALKNHQAEMREEMLATYGYRGPDGTAVDADELRDRRFKGHYNFALAHIGGGKMNVGIREIRKATAYGVKASVIVDVAKQILRRSVQLSR